MHLIKFSLNFLKITIYFFERGGMVKERERENLLLIHSSNEHRNQSWSKLTPESETRNSIIQPQVSPMGGKNSGS